VEKDAVRGFRGSGAGDGSGGERWRQRCGHTAMADGDDAIWTNRSLVLFFLFLFQRPSKRYPSEWHFSVKIESTKGVTRCTHSMQMGEARETPQKQLTTSFYVYKGIGLLGGNKLDRNRRLLLGFSGPPPRSCPRSPKEVALRTRQERNSMKF
jgi:hypothetical protein